MKKHACLFAVAAVLSLISAQGAFAQWADPAPLNTNAATDWGTDECPYVATDGAGTWVAVWSSGDDGGFLGADYDILIATSTDNGVTWTNPAPLNTNAATDEGTDIRPMVVTDGAGRWVAFWTSNETLGELGDDFDILVARSTDNGATWTTPYALERVVATHVDFDGDCDATTDGAGHWVYVWSSRADYQGVGHDFDILVSRSTDDGETWTLPAPLNSNALTDEATDLHPSVATDGAGTWLVVWDSSDGLGGTDEDILVAISTTNGVTWTEPTPLNANATTDSGSDALPHVATDSVGNWVAVWHSTENLGGTIETDLDILFARSTDNGVTWTYPARLNTNAATDSGSDQLPQVTTDGTGTWLAVWRSNDSLGGTVGTDEDLLVAWSTDNGATWTPPAPLNANAATDSGSDGEPRIGTDGAGTWLAVWDSPDDLGATIGADLDILVARSSDDLDGDGLLNEVETGTGVYADETNTGTDPNEPDTDGDGVSDRTEIAFGTDPLEAGDFPALPSVWWPVALVLLGVGALGRRSRTSTRR